MPTIINAYGGSYFEVNGVDGFFQTYFNPNPIFSSFTQPLFSIGGMTDLSGAPIAVDPLPGNGFGTVAVQKDLQYNQLLSSPGLLAYFELQGSVFGATQCWFAPCPGACTICGEPPPSPSPDPCKACDTGIVDPCTGSLGIRCGGDCTNNAQWNVHDVRLWVTVQEDDGIRLSRVIFRPKATFVDQNGACGPTCCNGPIGAVQTCNLCGFSSCGNACCSTGPPPLGRMNYCSCLQPWIENFSGKICADDGVCGIGIAGFVNINLQMWHTSGISFGFGPVAHLYDWDYIPFFADCNKPPCAIVGTPYLHFLEGMGGVLNPHTNRYVKYTLVDGTMPNGLTLHETDDLAAITAVGVINSSGGWTGADIGFEFTPVQVGRAWANLGDGINAILQIANVNSMSGQVTALTVIDGGDRYQVGDRYYFELDPNRSICIQIGAISSQRWIAGQIDGTPTTQQVSTFRFRVTDYSMGIDPKNSQWAENECWIGVCKTFASPPDLYCGDPPTGHCNIPYAWATQATGGFPPFNYYLDGGIVPPGLHITTMGAFAVNGTPIANGTYSFVIKVVDSHNQITRAKCSITICDCAGVANKVY